MENKIATTVEQSKKLLELGIDPDTADMYWMHTSFKDFWKLEVIQYIWRPFKGIKDDYIPAWSLSALMDILPADIKDYKLHIIKDNIIKGYFCSYRNKKNEVLASTSEFNVIDAVLEMIVYLKENKLI